jgi:ubiquinone/menaquinone biosynthesis C-methylase UbiE
MSAQEIDFDKMAESFDQVAPLLASVTDRLAECTVGLADGVSVLDIGCGTGEPGLTLRERHPGLRVLGVDASDAMVGVARRKVAERGLSGIRHEVMDSQDLAVAGGTVDVVVSRFGVLSFADPLAEAREMKRVLRPGGTFCIATWDAFSKSILSYAMLCAAGEVLPPHVVSAMQRQEQFAMPGRRESWLATAGLSDVDSELFSWPVDFVDEASMWDLVSGPAMLGAVVSGLDPDRLDKIRAEFGDLLSDYRRVDGSYVLPYACRVLWGRR